MKELLLLVILVWRLRVVQAHGLLRVPPQRSSMYRENFSVPINYDDNGLNCGGFTNQFSTNGGKCGLCGDPYQGPRPNEAGGKYATGLVGRNYTQGETIRAVARLTANHLGYFEFRLCVINSVVTRVSQPCLDRNLLEIRTGSGWSTKYYPGSNNGNYDVYVKLPKDVTCNRCVLQWKYRAGNNWGCSKEEGCCKGCGPQEHFINCADIAITSATATQEPPTSTVHASSSTQVASSTTQAASSTTQAAPSSTQTASWTTKAASSTAQATSSTAQATSSTAQTTSSTPQATSSTSDCREKKGWEYIYPWCRTNCALGFCPRTHCTCMGDAPDPYDSCVAAGAYTGQGHVTRWCVVNCRMNFCPVTHCKCPMISN